MTNFAQTNSGGASGTQTFVSGGTVNQTSGTINITGGDDQGVNIANYAGNLSGNAAQFVDVRHPFGKVTVKKQTSGDAADSDDLIQAIFTILTCGLGYMNYSLPHRYEIHDALERAPESDGLYLLCFVDKTSDSLSSVNVEDLFSSGGYHLPFEFHELNNKHLVFRCNLKGVVDEPEFIFSVTLFVQRVMAKTRLEATLGKDTAFNIEGFVNGVLEHITSLYDLQNNDERENAIVAINSTNGIVENLLLALGEDPVDSSGYQKYLESQGFQAVTDFLYSGGQPQTIGGEANPKFPK